MRRVTTLDVRHRLGELLDAVGRGETIEITRRGKPAVRLMPLPIENERFPTPASAANWLRANLVSIGAIKLRALRDDGLK